MLALEGVGLRSDGRLLALNSYESRLYQIGIHDGPALAVPHVVAKFYRPGRWSDEAILEEHALVEGQDPGTAGTEGAHGRSAPLEGLPTDRLRAHDPFISPERR